MKTDAVSNNQQIVEQVEYNIENYLDGMASIYTLVEDSINRSQGVVNPELKGKLETILKTRDDLVSIVFFSNQGQKMLGVPDLQMRKNTRVSEQEWFKLAEQNPGYLFYSEPHVQNLFEGQYRWVISMSKGVTLDINHNKVEGVLVVDINFKTVSDLCRSVNLGKTGYVYIVDETDGRIVYHPEQQLINIGLKNEPVSHALLMNSGYYFDQIDGRNRLVTVRSLRNIEWKIIGVSYLDELFAPENQFHQFIFMILAGVLLLVFLISAFMYIKISLPLKRLEKSMEKVERGDFDIVIDVKGGGEIQQLSRRFNLMVSRIRQLMEEIIKEQESKRKSEMEVLQAQINPHFLYNALNSVVRMIGTGKNNDVITTITSLSKLFRISLSKGKSIITVEEELEHVKHYLIIQQMRFKNKFDYEIEAQEEALSCKTLKLILQPIVENAIYHGIEEMVDRGHIQIKVIRESGELMFKIIDNGLGMTQQRAEEILTGNVKSDRGSGVGVRNVHERIKLYFGDTYGVRIESEIEEGTTVTILIPAVEEE